jgi:hypothetical protein
MPSPQAGDAPVRSSEQTAPAARRSPLRGAKTGEAVLADEEETASSGYGGVNFVERGGSGTPLYSILLHGGDLQFALNSDGSVKSSPDPAVAQRNGAMDGEQAAKSAGTAVWWLAGAGGGCLLGGLGRRHGGGRFHRTRCRFQLRLGPELQ